MDYEERRQLKEAWAQFALDYVKGSETWVFGTLTYADIDYGERYKERPPGLRARDTAVARFAGMVQGHSVVTEERGYRFGREHHHFVAGVTRSFAPWFTRYVAGDWSSRYGFVKFEQAKDLRQVARYVTKHLVKQTGLIWFDGVR